MYVTGTIKDLGLINANIDTVTGHYIGSLVGCLEDEGIVTGCYVDGGSVSGNSVVGGLVGENGGGTIANCYATNNVSGVADVGGLVGIIGRWANMRGAVLTNSYSMCTVSGNHGVGGIAGGNYGDIVASYSAGTVSGDQKTGGLVGYNRNAGSITSSFWDVETSDVFNMCGEGWYTCDDSFGKTTAEMQTAGTFVGEGWDFVEERDNGWEDVWWIDEGQDYPRLWWELLND